MTNPRLSLISDEVTQRLDEAVELARELGLSGLELRTVEDKAADAFSPQDLKRFHQALSEVGLKVPCLAGSFGKCPFEPAALRSEMDKLKRLLDACDALDAPIIRGFAFFDEGNGIELSRLADALRPAVEMAHARGRALCLEADPSVHTANHGALAKLLGLIGHPGAGAIYDPGNDVWDPAGEIPYPDGLAAIAPYVRHVHVKDALLENGKARAVQIGQGLVDYPGLLRALAEMGYAGWYSLEPHYRKAAVLSEAMLKRPGGSVFSQGGAQAARESAGAFAGLFASARQ